MTNKPREEDYFPKDLDLQDNEPIATRPPYHGSQSAGLKRFLKPALAVLVVLAFIGVGIWLWFFLFGEDENEFAAPDPQAIEEAAEIDTDEDIPAPTGYETIRSSNPRVELTHPDTWSLTEGDDDIRLESPQLSINTKDGGTIDNAVFRLYLRQGAREVDSQYIGQGLAAIPSEQLTYSDPATGQRDDTLISYFGQNATDNIAFLFIAGNFDLDEGDSLGPEYGQEDGTYIIAGGYSSDELADDLQMHPVDPEFFRSTSVYDEAIEILKSIRLL